MNDLLIGITIGVFVNLLSWWILFHGIVPSIDFSPSIGKISREVTEDGLSEYAYRIKIVNSGLRAIIDVEIMGRIRIRGLRPDFPDNWTVLHIPLGDSGGDTIRVPRIRPERRATDPVARIVRLGINHMPDIYQNPCYPVSVQQKAQARELTLEDVLSLGKEAELDFEVFGYDEFSGTRKLFISKTYTIDDIRPGPFAKGGLAVLQTHPAQPAHS